MVTVAGAYRMISQCRRAPGLPLAPTLSSDPSRVGLCCLHVHLMSRGSLRSTAVLTRREGVSASAAVEPAAPQEKKVEKKSVIAEVADRMDRTVPLVVLKRGKVRLFRDGQPMIYSGAIDRVVGRPTPKAGDCVTVGDGAEQIIGWGVFNPDSMFRVRMMQLETEVSQDPQFCLDIDALLEHRLQVASAMRLSIGLPGPETSVYRLCNSEGDRLSGLVVDVLGDVAVVSSSAAWVEKRRQRVTDCLLGMDHIGSVVWRQNKAMLREEGAAEEIPEGDVDAAEADESCDEDLPAGDKVVRVVENGVSYIAHPEGQKTGFYADQRDNRAAVARLCKGKRVLDLCCYSGGFAISAALSGASEVTAVDSSGLSARTMYLIRLYKATSTLWMICQTERNTAREDRNIEITVILGTVETALALGKQNAVMNGVQCEFVKADIKDYMRTAVKEGRKWDIIILDPPKLAPNRKSLPRATSKYTRLNSNAMRLTEPGGLLLTCSCSGAMTQSGKFVEVVKAAALQAGRQVSVIRVAGCGMDHPLNPDYPEGNYLTTMLVSVA